jgi:hypothetical protein
MQPNEWGIADQFHHAISDSYTNSKLKINNQRANKKDGANAMRISPSHAGVLPPSFFRWLNFLRRGGGYDPRLRHMQDAIPYLQNIYEFIDINYKVFLSFVKENQERPSGRSW